TLPRVRAIMFEAVPESVAQLGADGLATVLETLHELARRPVVDVGRRPAAPPTAPPAGTGDAAAREAQLLAYTTRACPTHPDDDPGPVVLRHLTDHARLSLLVHDHAPELHALLTQLGRRRTDEVLREFLAGTPASAWPAEQSAAFADWFARVGGDCSGVS